MEELEKLKETVNKLNQDVESNQGAILQILGKLEKNAQHAELKE